MKPLIWALMWLAIGPATAFGQGAGAGKPQLFVIRRPTIIAFFPPVTRTELDREPDTNEALSDFQYYAGAVREPLQKLGIDFREANFGSFQVQIGTKVRTFRSGTDRIGYFLAAPGKKPQVEHGVMTDADLLAVAKDYFGITSP